ncbi:MAG TPA: N-acetyltransferase [Beijerinckiaceae bacterium]|nr:N-acetyltransferase [Beijerinckiaceae bacterium]
MLRILEEHPSDAADREALLDAAVGADRFLKTSERLREGRLPAAGLALVARDGEALVGTLRLWHVATGDGRPALMLGPLAVAGSHRDQGIGGKLMRRGLTIAGARGHGAVLLVGDEPYYRRFGFSRTLAKALDLPGWYQPERFLGLELKPGALTGACGMVHATGPLDPAIDTPATLSMKAASGAEMR